MKKIYLMLFTLVFLVYKGHCQGAIINTIAGTGIAGYSGDGGSALAAQIDSTNFLATDPSGNIYISDVSNNVIRKIDPAGIITTIAGTGISGFSGDGGPATSAKLSYPKGIVVDSQGNIYVADQGNARIRKIDPSGIITTIAGTGIFGYTGDNGPAASASLYMIWGLTLDHQGNLLISDGAYSVIRKINTSGIITTIAGNGTWGYSGDGGSATSAQMNFPTSMALDTLGNIYIADASNYRIRKVDTSGIITTVAGNGVIGNGGDGGPATAAQLNGPFSIVSDAIGNLYFADTDNNKVRKIDPSGIISTVVGNGTAGFSGDGGPAILCQMNSTSNIAIDLSANLYISDFHNYRIRKVSGLVSIAEQNSTGNIEIFPNPANNYLCLEFGELYTNTTIEVTDMLGKIVKAGFYPESQKNIAIPVGDLSRGVYTVRFKSGNNFGVKKFIKD